MTVFDKKLKIWLVDDLANRRDHHEKIVQDYLPESQVFKVAHPIHLESLIQEHSAEIKSSYNLFFSDYNMHWRNVEWTPDLKCSEGLRPDSQYDNFPGTQRVLNKYKETIPNFLLVMLSTMVLEEGYPSQSQSDYIETSIDSWEYEDLPISTIEVQRIHKLSKPFSLEKLKKALKHYRFLIS